MAKHKTVFLFRGVPGSGKTTLANWLSGADTIAADDYPGIYDEDGMYVAANQKAAHAFCFKTYLEMLGEGCNPICVHNTFIELWQMESYKQAAYDAGYSVQIVHCEKLYLPNGKEAVNAHNVPDSVIHNMTQRFQPCADKMPDLGLLEMASTLENLKFPQYLWADMDHTIKGTASGKLFPESPEDIVLNPSFVSACKRFLVGSNHHFPICIVSNQRGIERKAKTKAFLIKEIEYLESLLKQQRIDIKIAVFAPEYESKRVIVYEPEAPVPWQGGQTQFKADKPNIGMLDYLKVALGIKQERIWYVGDAHKGGAHEDYEAVTIFGRHHPNINYIPVEMFGIASKII